MIERVRRAWIIILCLPCTALAAPVLKDSAPVLNSIDVQAAVGERPGIQRDVAIAERHAVLRAGTWTVPGDVVAGWVELFPGDGAWEQAE
jgi:hypothetical protein